VTTGAHAQHSRVSAHMAADVRVARARQACDTHPDEPGTGRKVVTTIYYRNPNATLHVGDALEILTAMPDRSADCIVTSPPYWAKRDYGISGQYGEEDAPAGYIATLRAVFSEARRVLADDGTCWLNLGDSYSAGNGTPHGIHAYVGTGLVGRQAAGLGTKNLLGLPWRVALALQEDGWIIRNAVVWHKPNAMPESVRDRLNCRYELIFLLVKSRRYWFDLDPIRMPHATGPASQARREPAGRHPGSARCSGQRPGTSRPRPQKYGPHTRQVTGARRYGTSRSNRRHPNGRNPGDVWSIPTRPYRGPHFAAYPLDIPTRCIQAGCKPGGMVLDPFCGTGTTGIAALTLGRRFTGIDLNSEFAELAAERLRQAASQPPGNGTVGSTGNGNGNGTDSGNESGTS
jgi:DNA modification methylase